MKGPQPPPAPGSAAETVRVELGARSYDIVVGEGLIAQAGSTVRPLIRGGRILVVSDENVARLHLPALSASLAAAGLEQASVTVPPGEQSKSFTRLEALLEELLETRPDRSVTLIAFGGGVVGDLAGFAASILLRGVDLIQIPTTLVAQVDSSVGGKTGINTRQGKNLVGSFHQPRLVLADIGVLDTLPERELRAGYAEVVKYALIGDAPFFDWLEGHGAVLLAGDRDARRHAVVTSAAAKARLVAADEREAGMRALLNLGHTFGHALEAETGYGGQLLHGEAIAIGAVLAFELSARLGLCPREDALRIVRHFASLGLPASPREVRGCHWDVESVIARMAYDKKARQGEIRFVLVRGIGDAFIAEDVPLDEARAVLGAAIVGAPPNAAQGLS